MIVTIVGNKDGIYIDPRNCESYIDPKDCINYDKIKGIDTYNHAVVYREKDGTMWFAQVGFESYDRDGNVIKFPKVEDKPLIYNSGRPCNNNDDIESLEEDHND